VKIVLFLILYFFFVLTVSYAQESDSIVLNSMNKELYKAENLAERGNFGESMQISTKVLQYALKTKNYKMQAVCYNMMGNAFYSVNDSLSFDYLNKAKKASEIINDTASIIIAYNNIGANYRDSGKHIIAEAYFKKALNLSSFIKERKGATVFPLFNLADIQVTLGNYKKGINYAKQVLETIDESKNYEERSIVGDLYEILSYAHYKLGNIKVSDYYYEKCEVFAKKHKFFGVLSFMYERRQQLYEADKKYKDAFIISKKLMAVNDTLIKIENFEMTKQVEAENFLRENKKKLIIADKEKEFQNAIIKKGKMYNVILVFFSFSLLLSLYFVFKRNKQFKLAKEHAENLSKVKSNFYSEISHELRTPLYAVIEISRLLLKENISEVQKEYIESLNFSGNHLLSLINNVLELNKVESGSLKLQILNFKLEELINNIAESLEFALRDSHNKIHIYYDNNIPKYLKGDSLKLAQIFINLVSNSIKFTNNGNIYITSKLVDRNDSEVKIYFEIRDDGLGISKEKQKKVFEAFYQEHSKNKNSYNGTGLGLSIVKRVLMAMDSQIKIESEVNKGASFSFEIRFLYSEKNNENTLSYKILAQDLIDSNVLIVDDNKINQLVTKKILDQLGMKSKTVSSGKEAIEIVKKETFDCILMDLHMPGLDGYETTNLIREFNNEIPIIALTAASTEEVKNKLVDCNMNGYVMKPFITSDFVEALHKAIIKNTVFV